MSTLVTIQPTDVIANSRTDINNNFSALNTDKIETSVLDTDTTLAANSDSKVATQKATKAYADSVAGANASTTAKGNVEEATSAEIIAGTGTGATGARLFVNPTSVAETGNDIIIKTKSTGKLNTAVLPNAGLYSAITSTGVQASGAVNYAHGLGVSPTRIKVTAMFRSTSAANSGRHSTSFGTYNGTTTTCIESHGDSGNSFAPGSSSTNIVILYDTNSRTATATFGATNVVLTWSGATDANVALLIESWA